MARGASNVQRQMTFAHRQLIAATRALSGADSEPIKAAARVLQASIREQLSTPASGRRTSLKTRKTYGGDPSAPGQAPHLQSGKARRSVKSAVVEGVRRVGTDMFYLRLLEKGLIAETKPRRKTVKARTRKDGKVSAMHTSRQLVIEPRPSFEPGLAAAKDRMQGAFVEAFKPAILKRVGGGR